MDPGRLKIIEGPYIKASVGKDVHLNILALNDILDHFRHTVPKLHQHVRDTVSSLRKKLADNDNFSIIIKVDDKTTSVVG